MKWSINAYNLPTPKKIRDWANKILAVTTSISTSSLITSYAKYGLIILIVMSIARLVVEFTYDEDKTNADV